MKSMCAAVLLTLLLGPTVRADWRPDPDDALQVSAREAADRFLAEQPKLRRYFDQAHAYAVFPTVTRGGFVFGFGRGEGVVIEGDTLSGYVKQRQLTLGAQIGAQRHAQIIFFRDAESLQAFQNDTREFIGQASGAFAKAGGGVSPGFSSSVAIFNLMRGGLMVEVAAGAVRYRFRAATKDDVKTDEIFPR